MGFPLYKRVLVSFRCFLLLVSATALVTAYMVVDGQRTRRVSFSLGQRQHSPLTKYNYPIVCSRLLMKTTENDGTESEPTKEEPVIIRGSDDPQLSDEVWEDVKTGEPPKWVVAKELLGINAFTYVLVGITVFFLGANLLLGPGWLGQTIGLQGTGTFTQVSDSLPDTVDLNDPDYLL